MPKPTLVPEQALLEHEIITTMTAGLQSWRPDLSYPESYSDMQACARAVIAMFEVKRSPLPRKLFAPCEADEQTIRNLERERDRAQAACAAKDEALREIAESPQLNCAHGHGDDCGGDKVRVALASFLDRPLLDELRQLREYLWFSHTHVGLYGDDGEMQCSQPPLTDFKRDPVERLIEHHRKAIGDELARLRGENVQLTKDLAGQVEFAARECERLRVEVVRAQDQYPPLKQEIVALKADAGELRDFVARQANSILSHDEKDRRLAVHADALRLAEEALVTQTHEHIPMLTRAEGEG